MNESLRTSAASDVPVYDGFISYSHAADDLLAPRLQAGLQRFAKPWWRRRAVRIFRDESSLAANPHLWSSITEALDDSSWFILLLSEDAASSEWVGKEIAHWVDHKAADRILPVVTDGSFGWEDGDVTGSSVPAALRGVFGEEPRWVDLRFARGETDLDLSNPGFSAAVADIASAIRGVPKDELASEEVRQHRRTVRTAWAAGGLVTLLAIAAIGFGISSVRNADEAERQAQVAQENADQASANAAEAKANAEEATRQGLDADRQREAAQEAERLARSRELAGAAVVELGSDPELATLLSVQAIDTAPSAALPLEVVNALWRAGTSNRLVHVHETDYIGHLALSQDGSRLAVTTDYQQLTMLDPNTWETIWNFSEDTADWFTFPDIGPDGRVAIGIVDSQSRVPYTAEPDDRPNRVVILDGETGQVQHTLEFPDCEAAELPRWSPDGRFLVVASGADGCPLEEFWLEVFDTTTWQSVARLPADGVAGPVGRWSDDGVLHSLPPWGAATAYAAGTFEALPSTDITGMGDVSPDGSSYVLFYSQGLGGTDFSAYKFDAVTGQQTDVIYKGTRYVSTPSGVEVSQDGRYVFVGTVGTFTHVYDLATGYEAFQLPTGTVWSLAYDPATGRLYSTSEDGGVSVWDLEASAVGVDRSGDLGTYSWVNGDSMTVGPEYGSMDVVDFGRGQWALQLFDPATGALIGDPIPDLVAGNSSWHEDGRVVAFDYSTFLNVVFDPETNERLPLFDCEVEAFDDYGDRFCAGPNEPLKYEVWASVDGTEIHAFGSSEWNYTYSGHYRRLDATTLEVLEELNPGDADVPPIPRSVVTTAGWTFGNSETDSMIAIDRSTGETLYESRWSPKIEVTPSGERLAITPLDVVVVINTSTWQEIARVDPGIIVRGLSFNADASLLAVGGNEGLAIIDIEAGRVVQQTDLEGVSDIHWIDDDTLLIGTNSGVVGTVSLSTDAFLDSVRGSLRRGFTDVECDRFNIDPCPTLDELRGG